MSRIGYALLLGLILVLTGCGYRSHNYMNANGSLHISQLMPNMMTHGASEFTLEVMGTGFGADSVVYWGTTPQATTYVNTGEVTTVISAADVANMGSVQVYVRSAGMNSNAVTFTIQ